MNNVYHCDSCGVEMECEDIYLETSDIRFCENCCHRLYKRVPTDVVFLLVEESDNGSDECGKFLINMALENPIM